MSEIIAASICICGDDLSRNGGQIHNYLCPFTPKCQHLVSRINIQTGEIEQGSCGSRLEPEYECHGTGCPLVQLCPNCGTRMDRRGIHNRDCPNNAYFRDSLIDPENHNYFERIIRFYQDITLPKTLPQIVDGNFDILDECSICFSNFSDSEVIMKSSRCQHCYHDHCIMQWIESENANHQKCPFCRTQIETIFKQKIG
jgi:hypothetical protein